MSQGVAFTSQDIACPARRGLPNETSDHPHPRFKTSHCLQVEFTLLNLTWKSLKNLDL